MNMKKGLFILAVCFIGMLIIMPTVWAGPSGKTTDNSGKPSSGGIKAVEAGANLTINDSNKNEVYKCNNTKVTINGSSCNLTFIGTCSNITINGSSNNIKANCKITSINVMGSYNNIHYSEKLNPSKPAYSELGAGNNLIKAP